MQTSSFFNTKSLNYRKWQSKLNQIKKSKTAKTLNDWPQIFSKQIEAFEQSKEQDYVFVFEQEVGGQRRFIVVEDLEHFWSFYGFIDPMKRHVYEVIRYQFPCYLYFDIEFYFKHQKEPKDQEEIMNDFKKCLIYHLYELYKIIVEPHNIIDLDSTSADKFSRHLVVNTENVIFKNYQCVSDFVNSFLCVAKRFVPTWFVFNETGSRIPFVDLAVYSKNRHFRMLLSCKYGKEQVFRIHPSNDKLIHELNSFHQWKRSLVSPRNSGNVELLDSPFNMIVAEMSCNNELNDNGSNGSRSNNDSNRNIKLGNNVDTVNSKCENELDLFVLELASERNHSHVSIRNKSLFKNGKIVVYYLNHSHFCERIGKRHKSNHVNYVMDLEREVVYQKCLDIDCKNYHGQEIHLNLIHGIPCAIILDEKYWK